MNLFVKIGVLALLAWSTQLTACQFLERRIELEKRQLMTQVRSAIEDKMTDITSPQKPRLDIKEIRAFIEAVLDHEEKRLYHQLEYEFGIDPEVLRKKCAELRAVYPKEDIHFDQQVPAPIVSRVKRRLINDFDASQIRAVTVGTKTDQVAQCENSVISLHNGFHHLDPVAQDGVLGHEMCHAKHNDQHFLNVLESLLRAETADGTQEDMNCAKAFLIKWTRYLELRADMRTAATQEIYAKGILRANEMLQEHQGEGPSWYPATSRRIGCARKTLDLYSVTRLLQNSNALKTRIQAYLPGKKRRVDGKENGLI